MRIPIFLLACSFPLLAWADLYVTQENGVTTISNQGKPKGKLLYSVKEDGAKPASPARRKTTASTATASTTPATRGKFGAKSQAVQKPEAYVAFVQGAAAHYQLPEALIWAVMKVESGFNPQAVSDRGAQGLMQLMPTTSTELGVTDPFDPEQNIYGGARLLRKLANRFDGDVVLALSGYHAGGGAVNAAGGIPYDRTSMYVGMVLKAYYAYKNAQ